jgi:hypothetical protein
MGMLLRTIWLAGAAALTRPATLGTSGGYHLGVGYDVSDALMRHDALDSSSCARPPSVPVRPTAGISFGSNPWSGSSAPLVASRKPLRLAA